MRKHLSKVEKKQKAGSKGRELTINIFLLLITLIVFFAFFEIILRVFYPQTQYNDEKNLFYQPNKNLGWSLIPNAEGYFKKEEFKVYVKMNSRGLRDKEVPYESSRQRILFLGDSFVWGYGVENNQTVSELLENKLKAIRK